MTHKLTNLNVMEISGVDEGANPGAHVVLFKNKGSENMDIKDIEKKLETVEKQLSDLTAENAVLKKQVSAKDEDIAKAKKDSTIEIQKKLDDQTVELTKAKEDLKKSTDEVSVLKGKNGDLELASEIQKKYPNSAGTTDEKVAKLKAIRAVADENVRKSLEADMDKVEKLATDFSKEAGTTEAGKSGSTGDEKLDTMTKNFVIEKSKEGKKLSYAQAQSEVLKTKEGKLAWAEAQKTAEKA